MGRDKRNEQRTEHFTKLVRNMMETPAWRALSPMAQALYPWLRLEWRGVNFNNNGQNGGPEPGSFVHTVRLYHTGKGDPASQVRKPMLYLKF